MDKVIVLNRDMTVLGTTSYKKAIKLVVKGRAESILDSNKKIHPSMYIPTVIRLVKAIRSLWRKRVEWSKRNVHVRDSYTCQYCGNPVSKSSATIDHVIPKGSGGKNSWENTVCACFACNNMKEDRTPSQAHMSIARQPYAPTIMEFLLMKIKAEGLEGVLQELGVY